MKTNSLVTPFLAAISLSLAITSIAPAPSQSQETKENPATRATHFTFVEACPSITPRAFEGSDGVTNLVYELILTNFNSNSTAIDSIEIAATDSGKSLLKLPAETLKAVMITPGVKKPDARMAPGATSVVFINIALTKDTRVPDKLSHKITYSGTIINKKETRTTTFETEVDKTKAVIIGAPLVGKKWLATGGYSSQSGHRRSLFPVNNRLLSAQRFAIDWVQLSDDNRLFTGDGKTNSSWIGYGKPVLAVADGTIYGIVNKFEDQTPGTPSGSITYPAGNSITLKIADKAYAMYAHLKPGSIKVKEGDTVKKGQVIAEVGNVGNSDGPHLHLHITEGPEVLESNGVPYVFDRFEISGAIDIKDMDANFDKPVSFPSVKADSPGIHQNQLIKEGLLIDFPELEK